MKHALAALLIFSSPAYAWEQQVSKDPITDAPTAVATALDTMAVLNDFNALSIRCSRGYPETAEVMLAGFGDTDDAKLVIRSDSRKPLPATSKREGKLAMVRGKAAINLILEMEQAKSSLVVRYAGETVKFAGDGASESVAVLRKICKF